MAFYNCPYAKDYYKEHGDSLTNDQYMDISCKINELKSPEEAISLMKSFDEYMQSRIARSDIVLHSFNGAYVKEMLQTLFEEGNVVTRCEVAFAARRYMEQCYNRFKEEPVFDFAEKLSGKDTLEKKCIQYFQKEDLSNALPIILSTMRENKALLKENATAFAEKLQEKILVRSERGTFYRLNEVINRFSMDDILSSHNLDSITSAQFIALALPEELKTLTADAKNHWYPCINEEIEQIVGKDIEALRAEAFQAESAPVHMNKEELLALIERDASQISQVKDNRTPEFLLEAVKRNGQVLLCLGKNEQTPEIQLEAVKHFGPAISAIENPTEEMVLEAVKQDGNNLQFVKDEHKSLAVCLAAYYNDKSALDYLSKNRPEHSEIMRSQVGFWYEAIEGFQVHSAVSRQETIKNLDLIKKVLSKEAYKEFIEAASHDSNMTVRSAAQRAIYVEDARERLGFNDKVEEFAKAYRAEYRTLYDMPDGGYKATGFNTAIDACTESWKQNEAFVKAFYGYLGDVPTNDRERAAFSFAVIKNPELVRACKPAFSEVAFRNMADAFLHSPDPEVRKMAASYGLANYLLTDPDIMARKEAERLLKPMKIEMPAKPKKGPEMDI